MKQLSSRIRTGIGIGGWITFAFVISFANAEEVKKQPVPDRIPAEKEAQKIQVPSPSGTKREMEQASPTQVLPTLQKPELHKKAPSLKPTPPSLQCSITAPPSAISAYEVPNNQVVSHSTHPPPFTVFWRIKISNTSPTNAQGCRLTIKEFRFGPLPYPPFDRCYCQDPFLNVTNFNLAVNQSYETTVNRTLKVRPHGCEGYRWEVLVEQCGPVRTCSHRVYY